MQSTIGSDLSTTYKRLRVRHVAMVGGAALAIAAAVGLGRLQGDGPASMTPTAPVPGAVGYARSPQLLVYLVGTEAEKRALEQDVATSPEWFEETTGLNTTVRIIALDPAQEESLEALAQLLPEASIGTGSGPAIKLVDMR